MSRGHGARPVPPGEAGSEAPPQPPPTARSTVDAATLGRAATRVLRQAAGGSAAITVLAIVIALVVGGVLIVLTEGAPLTPKGVTDAVGNAYLALIRGGIYDDTQASFADGIRPLLLSLGLATPLIAAGLGIGIAFRAGIFNIGGQGQMLVGGAFAGWVGSAASMPAGVHLLVAVGCGVAGGALFAAIAGVLKASTGAHEVIVTIMLNYVAFYLLSYLLTTVLQAPGSNNPISRPELSSATFPTILGEQYPLNLGFVAVIALTVFAAWLMTRSSLGFQFRAVGENAKAARVAGISVTRVVILTMVVSGALVGFAGAYQTLGQTTTGFGSTFDAGIGFNAITVALLGRNRAWGIFWAGILFGIFQSGGYAMQAAEGINVNIVLVLQSIIVLCIAAPPLVRALFRLPEPGRRRPDRADSSTKAIATR